MLLFDRFNLGHGFRKYFEIVPATDDSIRDAVYRVRHEVYCKELGFEPLRPDGRETDAFDAHSQHCLLRTSNERKTPVGCIRIVMAKSDEPDLLLPFERTCAATLDRSIIDPAKLPRDRIAEVSRLAVRSAFRRRKGERQEAAPVHEEDFGTIIQPRFPYIPIGLYLGAIALAARSGIETLFILTEPRLAAHFAKLGVDVRQIGGPVEHRGIRIPSMMDVQGIIKGMRFLMKPMWRAVEEEIEAGFERMRVAEHHPD